MVSLPMPYIFQIGTPLVLFNGRLFQPMQQPNVEDNYVQLYSSKFGLEEILTPGKLEEQYFRQNPEAVESIKQAFVRDYLSQDYISNERVSAELKQNKVLALIVQKILPIITAGQLESKIEGILGAEVQPSSTQPQQPQVREIPQSMRREYSAIKQKLINQIKKEYKQYALESSSQRDPLAAKIQELMRPSEAHSRYDTFTRLREESCLEELLGDNNLLIMDERIYSLVTAKNFLSYFQDGIQTRLYNQTQQFEASTDPSELIAILERNKSQIEHKYFSRITNKLKSSKLKINGAYYLPIFWGRTSELVERYKKLLEKSIKIEAIDQGLQNSTIFRQLAHEAQSLESIASRTQYEKNGAGFFRRDGSYIVYITTPPYALKSPHMRDSERYIALPAAKIGISIRYVTDSYSNSSSGTFEISDPFVINGHKHPFLGGDYDNCKICLGSWRDQNSPRLGRMTPEQRALGLLDQAKKTLMMGYRSGSNPHHRLDTDYFSRWLTKDEVQAKKLICLNDFGGRREY